MLSRLPFPVREIHPDNGSEFLNDHLLRFWQETVHGVRLSRSRAWHKNDTLVRAYLGDERLDTVEHTRLLNTLYDRMWLYYKLLPARPTPPREGRSACARWPLRHRYPPL